MLARASWIAAAAAAVLAAAAAGAAAEKDLCGQFQSTESQDYIFNNNAWNKDDSGSICTTVSEDASNSFSTVWHWTSEPPVVHAYPNIRYNASGFPLKLSDLVGLNVDLSWSMSPQGSSSAGLGDLDALGVQANVAIDMFGDRDAAKSQRAGAQEYEFMIWLAQFGDAAQPIGRNDAPVGTEAAGGADFTLYKGSNPRGQQVFSWVANSPLTSFTGDIVPLIHFLPHYGLVPFDTCLGILEFGTETFFAADQVNFTVDRFSASLTTPQSSGDGSTQMPSTDIVALPSSTANAASTGPMLRGSSSLGRALGISTSRAPAPSATAREDAVSSLARFISPLLLFVVLPLIGPLLL